ncbi:hypothetical protein Pyn_12756 [Prunus yedoensis var. nudiflora]|uniref:Uncharacterized protein n=1 Tax=Prunus yedoensis var. nudiflora TaxID=2094558 RepID=A0A314XLH6_PRUYE|nr:hypothetical protein Pyn_12756 [Prunus yedoensis var. nudiflora]
MGFLDEEEAEVGGGKVQGYTEMSKGIDYMAAAMCCSFVGVGLGGRDVKVMEKTWRDESIGGGER